MAEEANNSLNANHRRRLTVTCQYIDKLLADMEGTLQVSESQMAFPHYLPDLAPQQRRVVEDYIRRIRAQLIRVLDGQNIERPAADIPESRSLHTNLTFVEIAAEELKPEYMRGYGAVPSQSAVELNGIAGELKGLVKELDQFLMRGSEEDLARRLESLERVGDEVALLKKLESIIAEHGLVEFRSTLSMIIDRLEDKTFEIAIFGRVSSGKSSLLNAILETKVLPVGVTPVTSVPTRLVHGASPVIDVWFANRPAEQFEISRLRDFVTEQFNPGNEKHVTRIVVELPSVRLQDGVAFVDTPGLGSLASSGAAETLAYLPRCDLGVVMIDAGSTLTVDDLQTVQALYQSGIPATLLLSKADLLESEDRKRMIEYVKDHIRKELNLDLNVHAVSIMPDQKILLDRWFDEDIGPLYTQRQELKIRSVRRKLGTLRKSLAVGLRARLRRKGEVSPIKVEQLRVVETELRQSSGRLEELKRTARDMSNDLAYGKPQIIRLAATALAQAWSSQSLKGDAVSEIVHNAVAKTAEDHAQALRRRMNDIAQELDESLRSAANVLEIEHAPSEQELSNLVREMPAFEVARLNVRLHKPLLLRLFARPATTMLAKRLDHLIGEPLKVSLMTYGALLRDWSERTLNQMERRFDVYASGYRAQISRAVGSQQEPAADEEAIRRDLKALGVSTSEMQVTF